MKAETSLGAECLVSFELTFFLVVWGGGGGGGVARVLAGEALQDSVTSWKVALIVSCRSCGILRKDLSNLNKPSGTHAIDFQNALWKEGIPTC